MLQSVMKKARDGPPEQTHIRGSRWSYLNPIPACTLHTFHTTTSADLEQINMPPQVLESKAGRASTLGEGWYLYRCFGNEWNTFEGEKEE
ncbi:hypothetical protein SRHO_G00091330 [Serrasalmus rhombeus]